MPATAAAVRWDEILTVVWSSLVAGVGITALFAVVVFAFARAGERSRAGLSGAALRYGALAGVALLAFGAGVTLGVHVMLSK